MNPNYINDTSYSNDVIDKIEGLMEIVLLAVVYFLMWRNEYNPDLFHDFQHRGRFVIIGLYAFILIVCFVFTEGFRWGYLKLTDVIISQWVSLLMANFISYWQLCLVANGVITVWPMVKLTALQFFISLVCGTVFTRVYKIVNSKKNMIMIYGTENALKLKFKANKRLKDYHISEAMSLDEAGDDVYKIIERYDGVIINDLPGRPRNNILKHCYKNGISAYVVPKISDIIIRGADDFNLLDTPIVVTYGRGLTITQSFFKRIMDLVLCTIALIPSSIVMLITAIAIKLDDGGPVFFKQARVTRNGHVFDVIKFRSMIVNADNVQVDTLTPTVDGDPRITRVGRFIRATRIDELPQLFNILGGSMSIVGPRPERVEHVIKYSEEIPEFVYREKVKAGLTGYAQIYGKYNTSAYDKLRLDLMYIENYSVVLDIKLICRTIRVLFQKESTEGFDKVDELEQLKDEEIAKMKNDMVDDD